MAHDAAVLQDKSVDVNRHCVRTIMINVALLLLSGLGLALSECKEWRSCNITTRTKGSIDYSQYSGQHPEAEIKLYVDFLCGLGNVFS